MEVGWNLYGGLAQVGGLGDSGFMELLDMSYECISHSKTAALSHTSYTRVSISLLFVHTAGV